MATSGRMLAYAVASLAWLVFAGAAFAEEPRRQAYEASLSSQSPASATGLRQEIHYVNPDDPDSKPPAVERIVFRLPKGSKIDTSVPARCGASEAEFQLRGAAACPPETQVGTGALSVDTGAPNPGPRVLETDVRFFNNEDELILFAESTNTPGPPVRVVSRVVVGERTLTSTVPPLPGVPPPDPFLAIKDVVNRLDAIPGSGANGPPYIRTPPSCPRDGFWTITSVFTYRDGVEQTERATTPCRSAPDVHGCRDLRLGSASSDFFRGTGASEGYRGRGGGDVLLGRGGPDCLAGDGG
ncbi:MAG: hypothetical protein ACR2K6_07085, partial [Solirubrobacterales bacterium]